MLARLSLSLSVCTGTAAREIRTSASEVREVAELMLIGLWADCMIGTGCALVCTNVSRVGGTTT